MSAKAQADGLTAAAGFALSVMVGGILHCAPKWMV